MLAASHPSSKSSSAWSGSTASRESTWAEQPPREEREELAGRADQGALLRVEVALQTRDPASAVGPIEEAVARSGGRVVRRVYDESGHLLIVQIGTQDVPPLLARLERIGKLRKPLQAASPEEGSAVLDIRW